MKKLFSVVVVVLMLSLMLVGIAAANEAPDTPVSREAEVTPGDTTKEPVGEEPVAEEDYVGKDIELRDGEMGITSVSEGVEESGEDYVGKDLELKEGEVGIVSLPAGSAEELARQSGPVEEAKNNLPLYGGILAAALAAFVAYKKVLA